ncbi:hypothetical protein L6R52_37955, partial [Myxococcota bacterium]|nr:hypothetical protein [Myxococcota bacterium]
MKPNDLIAGYHFTRQIGDGETATVWLAREKASGVPVAVKLLKTELFPPSSVQGLYERLVGAVTDVGRLTHSHLTPVRSTILEPRLGVYGLVTEHVDGITLDKIEIPLGPDGRPGASDSRTLAGVLGWFLHLSAVLAWLHTNGVVHGKVKPQNVMLRTGLERPKLELLDLCWSNARIEAPSPDRTYAAPELASGDAPTPAADQWAAAKLLQNLIIGSAPELAPAQALAAAPVTLLKALQRATSRDPAQRFADMGQLFYAVEAVKTQLEAQLADEGVKAGVTASWAEKKRTTPTMQLAPQRRDATTSGPLVTGGFDVLPGGAAPTEPAMLPPPVVPAPRIEARARPGSGTGSGAKRAPIEAPSTRGVSSPSGTFSAVDASGLIESSAPDPFHGQDLSGPNSGFAAIGPKKPDDTEKLTPPSRASSAQEGSGAKAVARIQPRGKSADAAPAVSGRAPNGKAGTNKPDPNATQIEPVLAEDDAEAATGKRRTLVIAGASAALVLAVVFAWWLLFLRGGELTIRDPNEGRGQPPTQAQRAATADPEGSGDPTKTAAAAGNPGEIAAAAGNPGEIAAAAGNPTENPSVGGNPTEAAAGTGEPIEKTPGVEAAQATAEAKAAADAKAAA